MKAFILWAIVALFAFFAFCGCAAKAPLQIGHTYFVQWPGVPMYVVTVEQKYKRNFVYCRSVKDDSGWVCNFNIALYWAEAIQKSAPDILAPDIRVSQ